MGNPLRVGMGFVITQGEPNPCDTLVFLKASTTKAHTEKPTNKTKHSRSRPGTRGRKVASALSIACCLDSLVALLPHPLSQ